MASTTFHPPPPLLLNSPWLAQAAGIAGAAMLIGSTALATYAGAWMIGAPAIVWLLLFGRNIERFVLLLLLLLSVLAGGVMQDFGIRQTVFIAMFMLFARYLTVPVLPTAAMFLVGLVGYIVLQGEFSALFMLGPTFLLLLKAVEVRHGAKAEGRPTTVGENAAIGVLAGLALIFPLQGSGSRTALFVWLAFFVRQLTLPLLLLGAMAGAIILQMPGLLVVDKLMGSFSELTTPIPDDGIGFSMRALEGLVFLSWVETASLRELLIGSTEMIYLPGPILGKDIDPPFVPHNYLAAALFQFGIVGFLAIATYMISLWRHMEGFAPGRYLFFMMMIPGFITSAGFITTDYAIFAAAINGLIHRHGARLAP